MSRTPELSRSVRVDVAAGILSDAAGRVLISDRVRATSMQDYWEFPGGKIRNGESPVDALHRELSEELGIQVVTSEFFCSIEHDYPDLRVAIEFFLVREWQGEPSGKEGQILKWVRIEDLTTETVLPADAPVIGRLKILQENSKVSRC